MASTNHRNLRVDDHPWEPAKDRAGDRHGTTRSVIVRALLLAYVNGEADALVEKYLAAATADVGRPPRISPDGHGQAASG